MKGFLFFLLLFFAGYCSFCQDIITTVEGTDIRARVVDSTATEIKYRRFAANDDEVYSILKERIILIRFQNGAMRIFSNDSEEVFKAMGSNPAQKEIPRRIEEAPIAKAPDFSAKYNTYKGMKRTGMILSILGTAAMVGGSVALNDWGSSNYDYSTQRILLGTFSMVSGVTCVCVGVPLWITGAASQRKYRAGAPGVTVQLGPSRVGGGLSLSCRF